MAINPITSKVLVAVGDKWGAVGLWDVNDTKAENDGVEIFYVSFKVTLNQLILLVLKDYFFSLTPDPLIASHLTITIRTT
jgi:hypothetical protein